MATKATLRVSDRPKTSVLTIRPIQDKDNPWSQFESWAGERYFSDDKTVPLPKGSTP